VQVFLPDFAVQPEMRALFIMQMRILAACQVFMQLEYVAANVFRGKGRTIPPSVSGITSNLLRLPLAFLLSRTSLGVMGVWAAVSFTAGFRGVMVYAWYLLENRRQRKGEIKYNET